MSMGIADRVGLEALLLGLVALDRQTTDGMALEQRCTLDRVGCGIEGWSA